MSAETRHNTGTPSDMPLSWWVSADGRCGPDASDINPRGTQRNTGTPSNTPLSWLGLADGRCGPVVPVVQC